MIMRTFVGLALAAGMLAFSFGDSRADAPGGKANGQRGNPEAVFKKIDTNGDGKLSKDEFRAFIEKATNGTRKEKPELIDKLFERLDENGDGYLSLEEFKKLRELREKIAEKRKAKQGNEDGTPKQQ
jgi:hypothetical protein